MPRTKVKKAVPAKQIEVNIKSEPVEIETTNEFTLHTLIAKGDMMKSAIKELANKKIPEITKLCDSYRKTIEASSIGVKDLEVSTLPADGITTTPGGKQILNVDDNSDKLQNKAKTVAEGNHNYNEFQTPYNPTVFSSFNTVTPKVAPNIPLALLRRPKMGEMILSLNGSPIMPNSADSEPASINIPMVDGTVMTIIPEEVLPIDDVSLQVDPKAKEHLKILYNRLKCIVDDEV